MLQQLNWHKNALYNYDLEFKIPFFIYFLLFILLFLSKIKSD